MKYPILNSAIFPLLCLPLLANTSAAANYKIGLDNELIITTTSDKQIIDNVFSGEENNAEYSTLTEFNNQPALFYSSRMDELYFTFSQARPELVDCVYVSLRTQINVPVRKFRCGLNEKVSPSLFELHRDDFADTLPKLASDPNIATQVNNKGKVIIPVDKAENFEVQAVYTEHSLANGEPDIFIEQQGEQVKIKANEYFVEYVHLNDELTAKGLFKVINQESQILQAW